MSREILFKAKHIHASEENEHLDGWEKSRGANVEYGYALAKGKDIMFQKEDKKDDGPRE